MNSKPSTGQGDWKWYGWKNLCKQQSSRDLDFLIMLKRLENQDDGHTVIENVNIR